MDDTTRGRIHRMIETELKGGILSKMEWFTEDYPISIDLALGYMMGRLEQKALRESSQAGMYRWTEEQIEEYDRTARDLVRQVRSRILGDIETEQHR